MNKNTMVFKADDQYETKIRDVIKTVFDALEEKGYDPIAQLSGYILSGDPSYITNNNNARSMIKHIDRDDLVEELLKYYLNIE